MTKEEERSQVVYFAETLAKIMIKNNPSVGRHEVLTVITNFYQHIKLVSYPAHFEYMSDMEVKATIAETVKRLCDSR